MNIAPLRKLNSFITYLGALVNLFFEAVFQTFNPPFIRRRHIVDQMVRIGIESLPIVTLISLFTGIILAFQTAYQMEKMSAEMYIANIVALSITRELGPVLTALIVAGRVGAAITAELGTMNVTEQIDALETLATSPIKFLVVPRLLSLMLMLPILTIYSDLIGMFGGYLICVYKLGINSHLYIDLTFETLAYKDIFTGLIKACFFGIIVAMVACLEGLNTKGGAEGVGKATTVAVVTSFILIIAVDCLLTALFYFVI